MFIVTPAFLWPDIVGMYHHFKKRILVHNVAKARLDQLVLLTDELAHNYLSRRTKPSEHLICLVQRDS